MWALAESFGASVTKTARVAWLLKTDGENAYVADE
jgi:hypothetical protein